MELDHMNALPAPLFEKLTRQDPRTAVQDYRAVLTYVWEHPDTDEETRQAAGDLLKDPLTSEQAIREMKQIRETSFLMVWKNKQNPSNNALAN